MGPDGAIGRRARLRNGLLWVRVPLWAPRNDDMTETILGAKKIVRAIFGRVGSIGRACEVCPH